MMCTHDTVNYEFIMGTRNINFFVYSSLTSSLVYFVLRIHLNFSKGILFSCLEIHLIYLLDRVLGIKMMFYIDIWLSLCNFSIFRIHLASNIQFCTLLNDVYKEMLFMILTRKLNFNEIQNLTMVDCDYWAKINSFKLPSYYVTCIIEYMQINLSRMLP